jgi:hypothetical protein
MVSGNAKLGSLDYFGLLTTMDDIVMVQKVDRVQHLLDSLGCILLCELALLANPVKQLSSSRKLRDDVVFVLDEGAVSFNGRMIPW